MIKAIWRHLCSRLIFDRVRLCWFWFCSVWFGWFWFTVYEGHRLLGRAGFLSWCACHQVIFLYLRHLGLLNAGDAGIRIWLLGRSWRGDAARWMHLARHCRWLWCHCRDYQVLTFRQFPVSSALWSTAFNRRNWSCDKKNWLPIKYNSIRKTPDGHLYNCFCLVHNLDYKHVTDRLFKQK